MSLVMEALFISTMFFSPRHTQVQAVDRGILLQLDTCTMVRTVCWP